jgi:hypothetical protein
MPLRRFISSYASIDVIASIDVVLLRSVLPCCFVLCSKRVKVRDVEIMLCNIERHG